MPLPRARFAALALALAFVATAARAQSPEEVQIARQTAVEGLAAYKASDYERAKRLFEQARALYPSGQILRMHGYTLVGLKEWLRAIDEMEAALTTTVAPLNEADRKDVEEQIARAMTNVGRVTPTSKLVAAEIAVDGGPPRALPLDKPLVLLPGKHTLVATSPSHPEVSREIEVEAGQNIEVAVDPEEPKAPTPAATVAPAPQPEPDARPRTAWFPHQQTVGFVAAGTGVGLGIAALATALAGAGLRSQVEDDVAAHEAAFGSGCARGDRQLCLYDREVINHDSDRADAARDASVWLGVSAGVLAASGIVLLAFYPWGGEGSKSSGRLACTSAGPGLRCAGTF